MANDGAPNIHEKHLLVNMYDSYQKHFRQHNQENLCAINF